MPNQKPEKEEWEDPSPKKKKTHWLSTILITSVFYIFSSGPAALLTSMEVIPVEFYATVYAPVFALANQVPAFDGALVWYIEFWDR